MIQLFDLKNTSIDSLFEMVEIRCNYMHNALPEDRWQCDMHSHPNYELCYIADGCGICNVDGQLYEAHPGDIFVIPPGVDHFERADEQNPFNIVFLKIDHVGESTESLRALFVESQGLAACCSAWKPMIPGLFEQIQREICEANPGYLTVVNGILRTIYIAIFRDKFVALKDSSITDSINNPNKNIQLFKQVEHFMYANLNRKITIESLAERFHYHPKYLSRLVKEATSYTLAQHITNMRINRARDYLMYSDVSIEAIVDQVGFISVSSFYKFFKKQTGFTPGEYRKKAKRLIYQGRTKDIERLYDLE